MSNGMNRSLQEQKNNEMRKRSKVSDYVNGESPFFATRTLFRNAVGYEPLSYDEWLATPDSYKAAALYVTFFDQITLAWSKAKSFYVLDEDGVSTMMQYLMKNTPILIADKKKYTRAYIYKVAYNCLYCVSRDIKRDRDAYENNVSQYVNAGDDTLDLFDILPDDENVEDVKYIQNRSDKFWSYIHNPELFSEDELSVMDNLLNGETMTKTARYRKRKIVETLKSKLADMRSKYYGDIEHVDVYDNSNFAYVLANESNIQSAVVLLPSGEEVVYYGERIKCDDGSIDINFFGASADYRVNIEDSKSLKVVDIEYK